MYDTNLQQRFYSAHIIIIAVEINVLRTKFKIIMIELKFAQTGYSHKLQIPSSVEQLQQFVSMSFKIPINEQCLISKNGHMLKSQSNNFFKKIFAKASSNQSKSQKLYSIYLYNQKSLLKDDDEAEVNDSTSLEILRRKCETLKGLRENYFELMPIDKLQLQNSCEFLRDFPLFEKTSQIKASIKDFFEKWSEFKDIYSSSVSEIECCQNQRKSVELLSRFVHQVISNQHGKIKKMMEMVKSDAISTENITAIRKKEEQLKKKIQKKFQFFIIFHQEKEMQELNRDLILIDQQNHENFKTLQTFDKKLKESSSNFSTNLINILQKKDHSLISAFSYEISSIEKQILAALGQVTEYLKKGKQHFCNLTRISRSYKLLVKQFYKQFIECLKQKKRISQKRQKLQKYAIQLCQKHVQGQKQGKEADIFTKVREQQQINRKKFNKILNKQMQKVRNLLENQFKRRSSFSDQWKKIKKNENNEVHQIENINVPQFSISYQGTNDQLFSSQSLSDEAFSELFGVDTSNINEKLLKQLEIIKTCKSNLKKSDSFTARMENLSKILEKSSIIYQKVFQSKLEEEQKLWKERIEKNCQQKTDLLCKIRSLQEKIQNLEHLTIKNEEIKSFPESQQILLQKMKNLESKYFEAEQCFKQTQQAKNKQINQKKGKIFELQRQNDELKQKILHQLQMTQSLIEQIRNQKDLQNELNLLYNDQKQKSEKYMMEIQNLEERLKETQNQQNRDRVQNQSDNTETMMNENVTSQMKQYQNQIDELQQMNRELNEELVKIFSTQTEDVQCQTQKLKAETVQNQISISPTIHEGELRLFIPFNNEKYVGINLNPKGQELMSEINERECPYLLNLQKFSPKIQELLRQCSLILILKVKQIQKGPEFLVSGQIEHLMGFEDEESNFVIKDYAGWIS